ncbi:uncharacterized protein LOC110683654 [Chenopodium quinoa]|uniref:uncharacterized protein LOC110683654 n=1 Tax=Chenopodium quinoa TaxID=63459 RepID=UPI000B781957|nr:uncharacterized protein LOC110683654 [Chenopodium quinoa]
MVKHWMNIQESIYKQKSRVDWIKLGDSNSHYFFSVVKHRQGRNRIDSIFTEDDVLLKDPDLIENEIVGFYKGLLGSSASSLPAIGDDKAPGIDGFNAVFFKKSWPMIKTDIYTAIFSFFETGVIAKQWNYTTITLVPKVQHPSYVREFRPISCCTMLYKLISKVLTNRIAKVVGTVIDDAQAGFIPGKHIGDNILLASELIKGYSHKFVSPRCMIKIDLRKAYDSVEWPFLQTVLEEFGFPHSVVKWIMTCVCSVSYSVMVNGFPDKPFSAKKGLSQGDPMSPFLFALCMEYLSRCLKEMTGNPNFNFHPTCEKLGITHMIKSEVYFGGISDSDKDQLQTVLGMSRGSLPFRYLGVPLLQLIKSVLFGIQAYWAQIFILPKKILREIEAKFRVFLWTGKNTYTKKAPVSWHRMTLPKVCGGWNITSLGDWNKAAICKILWDLAHKSDNMWVKWVHTYYFNNRNIWTATIPKKCSWVLKKILTCKDIIDDIGGWSSIVKNGKMSIAKLYARIQPQAPTVEWKRSVFNNQAAPKSIFITWLALLDKLATKDRIFKWNTSCDPICFFCQNTCEFVSHLFFCCPYSKTIWEQILKLLDVKKAVQPFRIEQQ